MKNCRWIADWLISHTLSPSTCASVRACASGAGAEKGRVCCRVVSSFGASVAAALPSPSSRDRSIPYRYHYAQICRLPTSSPVRVKRPDEFIRYSIRNGAQPCRHVNLRFEAEHFPAQRKSSVETRWHVCPPLAGGALQPGYRRSADHPKRPQPKPRLSLNEPRSACTDVSVCGAPSH